MALASEELAPPNKKVKVAGVDNRQIVSESTKNLNANMYTQSQSNVNGKAVNGKTNDAAEIDSNLYSRQIYALGESAMTKLRKANVLISGMGAVGVEIAKNLILAGVRHVTIHDTKVANWYDLSAQYYLTAEDIGKNRADACFFKLEELNDSVVVTHKMQPLAEDWVKEYDLVVLTEATFDEQKAINQWTRNHGKFFISADARGLFSYSFVDLGEQFRIDDPNGDPCREVLIEFVDRETGNVHTLENALHGLEDGDAVTFVEVKGMTELNGCEPRKCRNVAENNIFNIGDIPANWGAYEMSGRVKQVKVPSYLDFKPLAQALEEPECVIWDFAHFDGPQHLIKLWTAVGAFEAQHNRRPGVHSDADLELLRGFLPADHGIPDEWVKQFSYQQLGNLQPVSSVIGGITAQEAIKAVTNHTLPQKQFLFTHHLEALPGSYSKLDIANLTADKCQPRNSRYDGQAAVFGWDYQQEIQRQNWFIVGAGAIGCELLKNFSMAGVGCGKDGKLIITDMDQIEVSNLNRQFLFRRPNVGQKKSECAAAAARNFNPDLNIEALTDRVGDDTEHIFTDKFFDGLTGIANALDNVDARRYMDRRCVYYRLPLLESGTMGTKGNTQVVYPDVTESYSSTNDPPEKDIPICTLKNFPYEIQHTIQWARSLFEDLFTSPAEKVNNYLEDVRGFLERLKEMNPGQQVQDLQLLKQALVDDKPADAAGCVKWARQLFQYYYHNEISQLLHNFPAEQITSSGVKFWSGTKRCPHSLKWDPNNQFHLDFVYSASILRAQQYNLEPIVDRAAVIAIAAAYEPAPFVPRAGVKIAVTDAEAQANSDAAMIGDTDTLIDGLKLALARLQLRDTPRMQLIDFEKDDDTNHHVEFVTAASNLRAENYDIPLADAAKTKQIAGRIIPALATTTSVVAGLVAIELYKTVESGARFAAAPLERFKNGFLNLAGPLYAFSEPGAAPKKKYGETVFTLWDRLEVHGPKTLQQLIDWVKENTGLQVSMVSSGVSLLYAFFQPKAKVELRLAKNLKDAVEEVSKKEVPSHRRALVLEIMATDDDEEDVEIPFVQYYLE